MAESKTGRFCPWHTWKKRKAVCQPQAAFLRTLLGQACNPSASSRPAFSAASSFPQNVWFRHGPKASRKIPVLAHQQQLKAGYQPRVSAWTRGPGLHNGCPVTMCSVALAIQVTPGRSQGPERRRAGRKMAFPFLSWSQGQER